uniref:Uncharacterized protein n=1 Tax=Populus trichocarpa TaxID=3694 RepID=A9P8S2_POPTR|nr:unknown [Populus trichocarpa]
MDAGKCGLSLCLAGIFLLLIRCIMYCKSRHGQFFCDSFFA